MEKDEIRQRIESLTPGARDALIQLSFDNLGGHKEENIKELIDAGLIEAGPTFTGITNVVHIAVCEWCSDNVEDDEQ